MEGKRKEELVSNCATLAVKGHEVSGYVIAYQDARGVHVLFDGGLATTKGLAIMAVELIEQGPMED